MNRNYLYIYETAEELAMKNAHLIEILQGYCEGREEDNCNREALLEVLETIKENQNELITQIDLSNTKLGNFLYTQGLLE